MGISDRIEGTIENWRVKWGQALKNFLTAPIAFGLELLLDIIGKAAAPKLKPLIDRMEATGKVPPELQPLLDELKEPTGEVGALFAQSASSSLIGGAFGKIADAILLPIAYAINKGTLNVELSASQYLALWLRGIVSPELLKERLSWQGLEPELVGHLKELTQIRLDPMSWITAFRRGYPDFAKIEDDLKAQGWDDDRIKALKFFTLYYPSPAELIHWTAREVFEPEMVAKYGLRAGADKLQRDLFYKAGMDDAQIDNHWIAHWEHASWMQIVEMLHRGLITEEEVKEWFPLVEMAPHWADLLIQTAYTWPTRVDVRRWWDMRTIDETELRRLYSGMGYRGANLDNYILWTKVYTDFPSLMARWTKGWITEDDVRRELTALGMPAERVETMIQEKIKPEEAARVEEGKTLTKTEIYKGVKQGFISREEGTELIMDLGYNRAEAVYLMDINVAVLEGSPETFAEFKDLTTKYKIATGREVTPMPEELKKAAAEVVRLTKEVEDLAHAVEEEEKTLLPDKILPEEATARLKELQVFRNRAISELERVKSEYDRQVAEWKHGLL